MGVWPSTVVPAASSGVCDYLKEWDVFAGGGDMKDVDGNRNKLCFGILDENNVSFYIRRVTECEYSRANKCWSMFFFPAMIALWQEEEVHAGGGRSELQRGELML